MEKYIRKKIRPGGSQSGRRGTIMNPVDGRLLLKIDGLAVWANAHVKLGASIGLTRLDINETLRHWLDRTDDLRCPAKIHGRSKLASDRQ